MVVPSKMKTSSYLMLDQVSLVWQMLAPTPMAANFSFALSRFQLMFTFRLLSPLRTSCYELERSIITPMLIYMYCRHHGWIKGMLYSGRFWKAWIPLSSLNHKRLIEETALGRRWLSVTVVSFQCLKP
ncbi:hypothetical protein Gohar_016297, partial [Gossypium harknessii]|nr:hypothetical protein [Gossypium harknessii]